MPRGLAWPAVGLCLAALLCGCATPPLRSRAHAASAPRRGGGDASSRQQAAAADDGVPVAADRQGPATRTPWPSQAAMTSRRRPGPSNSVPAGRANPRAQDADPRGPEATSPSGGAPLVAAAAAAPRIHPDSLIDTEGPDEEIDELEHDVRRTLVEPPAEEAHSTAESTTGVVPAAAQAAAPKSNPRKSALRATVEVAAPRQAGVSRAASGLGPDSRAESGADRLSELIAEAEARLPVFDPAADDEQRRDYVRQHVELRMLYYLSNQPELALQAIPGIEPAEQEFWQQAFWGLANYFDADSIPDPADRAAQTVAQFSSAIQRLQERANLELRNVTFCHKIGSFGNYEKYARDEFTPGQEVLLYAEVANVRSEPTADGRYRTTLKSKLEIHPYGREDEVLERIELPETVDVCRTFRRDYFHSYQFAIPAGLSLGPHVLTLVVEDPLGRRTAAYTLNFLVR